MHAPIVRYVAENVTHVMEQLSVIARRFSLKFFHPFEALKHLIVTLLCDKITDSFCVLYFAPDNFLDLRCAPVFPFFFAEHGDVVSEGKQQACDCCHQAAAFCYISVI
jgi:hypothetical protein